MHQYTGERYKDIYTLTYVQSYTLSSKNEFGLLLHVKVGMLQIKTINNLKKRNPNQFYDEYNLLMSHEKE